MATIIEGTKSYSGSGEIGGKARGLLFLQQHGFLTPVFFVIDHHSIEEINAKKISLDEVIQNWIREHKIQPGKLWAVRSSAAIEDGSEQSFAGFFKTEINVKTKDLKSAIESVISSYLRLEQQDYSKHKRSSSGLIIQEMIRSEYSGVVFSHNPNDVSDPTVYINLIPGLGENLVSGKEEAYCITFQNKKFQFPDNQEIFNGEYFDERLIPVKRSGAEILKDTEQFLTGLVNGAQKLSELKKSPVDIEFTTAGNKLYWLQVRPITTGKEEKIIWDNTSSEANFPGITLPLSISMAGNSFYRAYKSMAVFLRMPEAVLAKNERLLQNMSGEIQGALYYNITSWQKLIYQLPFGKRASKAIHSMWGMSDATFNDSGLSMPVFSKLRMLLRLIGSFFLFSKLKNEYVARFESARRQFENIDLASKTEEELISLYKDLEERLGSNWQAPMLNGFFTVLSFSTLKFCVRRSRLIKKYPNFINDILLSQGDVISVTILNEFQELRRKISESKSLQEIIRNEDAAIVIKILAEKEPDFLRQIQRYIDLYGERSEEGELKMETVNYKEDPHLLIDKLRDMSGKSTIGKREKLSFDYKKILQEEYKYRVIRRLLFSVLIKQTIARFRDRENLKFMRTVTFHWVRRIFRMLDQKFYAKGIIVERGDTLYLNLQELLHPALASSYKNIIAGRKVAYQEYAVSERQTRYIQQGENFTAVSKADIDVSGNEMSGTGCCSGLAKGKVKVVGQKVEHIENISEKILVSEYFEPGKLAVYSEAKGLISVRGNLLSHTAIVCREMGIPSIVGAKGLLNRVKDGDILEMNGATGKIKLLSGSE